MQSELTETVKDEILTLITKPQEGWSGPHAWVNPRVVCNWYTDKGSTAQKALLGTCCLQVPLLGWEPGHRPFPHHRRTAPDIQEGWDSSLASKEAPWRRSCVTCTFLDQSLWLGTVIGPPWALGPHLGSEGLDILKESILDSKEKSYLILPGLLSRLLG